MADDLSQKTRLLVNSLYKRTVSGSLSWYVGEYSNTIECRIGENFIQLTQFSDDFGDDIQYILFVKDKIGNVKDRIDEGMLSVKDLSASILSDDDYSAVDRLTRLYFEGRRRALGAGDTLDEILGNLSAEK